MAVSPAAEPPAALTGAEFSARMAAFAPYERGPGLAVALSGGPDSTALVLLAQAWALERGGTLLALTVDHGLRPESADEAARVHVWCAARGIRHRTLTWAGPKPSTGIQAAARAVRYRLLEECCADEGMLHLLVGHSADDQTETLALRAERRSGEEGMAGMAGVRELAFVRLLRPLLDIPKSRLVATCRAHGQDWIEDPSNRDARYSRSRLRAGGAAPPVGTTPRDAGLGRVATDQAVAELLATSLAVFPEGYAELDLGPFLAADAPLRRLGLQRTLLVVGGEPYPPRRERLDRLLAEIGSGELRGGRTLAGCRVAPRRGGLRIWRERAAQQAAVPLRPGKTVWWDGRFRVMLSPDTTPAVIGALGEGGWQQWIRENPDAQPPVPPQVAHTLPAAYRPSAAPVAPQLLANHTFAGNFPVIATFAPIHRAAGAPFGVV